MFEIILYRNSAGEWYAKAPGVQSIMRFAYMETAIQWAWAMKERAKSTQSLPEKK